MFSNKTKQLPLSHAEKLRNHMAVFHETKKALDELNNEVTSDIESLESQLVVLRQTHGEINDARNRITMITG